MGSLDEARKKIEERRAEQQTGGGIDLWFREGDIAIAHFICSGQENDPYFDTYVAHEHPASGQGKWPTLHYCPVQSKHDQNYDCKDCRESVKTKDRMIMWLHVYDILHSSLKQGESLPQVVWNSKQYFRRQVNAPRLWETSAWRESPLDDILMLGAQLGNLHASRINLLCTGAGLSRRFKIYMEPGSPALDEAAYQADLPQLRPVVEILRDQLVKVPTQTNPQPTAAPAQPTAAVYTPTASVPAYNPSSAPPWEEKQEPVTLEYKTEPAPPASVPKNLF